jgi:hypothetical protein
VTALAVVLFVAAFVLAAPWWWLAAAGWAAICLYRIGGGE